MKRTDYLVALVIVLFVVMLGSRYGKMDSPLSTALPVRIEAGEPEPDIAPIVPVVAKAISYEPLKDRPLPVDRFRSNWMVYESIMNSNRWWDDLPEDNETQERIAARAVAKAKMEENEAWILGVFGSAEAVKTYSDWRWIEITRGTGATPDQMAEMEGHSLEVMARFATLKPGGLERGLESYRMRIAHIYELSAERQNAHVIALSNRVVRMPSQEEREKEREKWAVYPSHP